MQVCCDMLFACAQIDPNGGGWTNAASASVEVAVACRSSPFEAHTREEAFFRVGFRCLQIKKRCWPTSADAIPAGRVDNSVRSVNACDVVEKVVFCPEACQISAAKHL